MGLLVTCFQILLHICGLNFGLKLRRKMKHEPIKALSAFGHVFLRLQKFPGI